MVSFLTNKPLIIVGGSHTTRRMVLATCPQCFQERLVRIDNYNQSPRVLCYKCAHQRSATMMRWRKKYIKEGACVKCGSDMFYTDEDGLKHCYCGRVEYAQD